jgi:capsular exopolysaccharide synthesis family protein
MARKAQSIVDLFKAESAFATEFRRLLHRLPLFGNKPEMKSLMITSAMLGEGKSTACSFLAITAAVQTGMKTLIIDCDLRRPVIHKQFGLERGYGLTDIIGEGFSLQDALKKTRIDKLDIITAGNLRHHPSEDLDVETVGSVLNELKFYYDLIILDTAPVLPVSDPMLLASKVDGILLVVKAGDTNRKLVVRALDILSANRERILGVMLNNMKNVLPYYYDHSYYAYRYRMTKPPKEGPGQTSSGRIGRGKKGGKGATVRRDIPQK